MVMKGFTRNFKPLEILTEEQVKMIHQGALDLLQETGIRFEHESALKLFEKNGCAVDYGKMRVRFPEGLVEECLRRCPSSFHIYSRDPDRDLCIGGNTLYFKTFPGLQWVDLDTWKPRKPTRREFYDAITVLDALDNLHTPGAYTPTFGYEGVPPVMCIPECVAAKMRNTTKLQWEGYSQDCEIFSIKMAKGAGTEIIGSSIAAPPLTYYRDAVEATFRYLEAGFPLFIASGDVMGATAPATIAGAAVTFNAELMAMIVLAQVIKPGTRIIVGDFCFPMHMRTGSPRFGAIESSLHSAAFSQVWRRNGIPTIISSVGPSSSKRIDFQCGYEKAIASVISALSGANLIELHGGIHGELTYHSVQAILDDDIAGMIGRFIEGVKVTDETLALDLMKEVGPIPGHYLDREHTRKMWKQFIPKAADLLTYPEWEMKGRMSDIDCAKKRMEGILSTHKARPVTPEQDKEIDEILEEARQYYKEKNML